MYDVIVIGGGAAGLSAARTASGFGKKVLLIEQHRLGGECTWSGCVPSKTLIRVAKQVYEAKKLGEWLGKPQLALSGADQAAIRNRLKAVQSAIYEEENPEALARWGVDCVQETAFVLAPGVVRAGATEYRTKTIIVATGSEPAVPPIEGLAQARYWTNQSMFSLDPWPKTLAILGAGPIGVEMAQTWARLGTRVTLIDHHDRILHKEEPQLTEVLQGRLLAEGVELELGRKVLRVDPHESPVLWLDNGKAITVDQILVAAGRRPRTSGLGLEAVGVAIEEDGIVVDRRLRTSVKTILAVGDCIQGPRLSHHSNVQGITAALGTIFPWPVPLDNRHLPWVTFSDPELARSGLTEAQARRRWGDRVLVVTLPMAGLDRAKTDDATVGLAKYILDPRGRLVGIHILGSHAGELLHEPHLAKSLGIPLRKLQSVIHAYPTLSDIHKQAGRKALLAQIESIAIVRWWRKRAN